MKKFFSFLMMAIAGFAFIACEDVPEPYGINLIPSFTSEPAEPKGDGSQANPFNVAGAQAFIKTLEADVNSAEVYISGIVSMVKKIDTSYGNAEYYISDDGSVTNQLYVYRGYSLNGDKFKATDEIKIGDKVVILGKLVNYQGNTPEVATGSKIISINAEGGGDDPAEVILSETFASSQGEFTTENVVKPAELENIWVNDSKYSCMKATAYADNKNYASNALLISPVIDLTAVEHAVLTFDHASKYFASSSKDECSVEVREAGATDWTVLTVSNWPAEDFKFVSSGDIDLKDYIGKKIQIAFRYTSTATKAGTWEVKNFLVENREAKGDIPNPNPQPTEGEGSGTAADPYNVAAALSLIQALGADVNSAEIYIKGTISQIKSIDTGQYGNAEYYISDDGTTMNQLYVYRGYGLNGNKFTSDKDIQVGDDVVIVGKVVNFKGTTPEVATGSKIYQLNGEGGGGDTPQPQPGEGKGTGTLDDPYNAVKATEVATALGSGNTSTESYYIKGKISEVKYTFDAEHGTATFFISDDGAKTNQFQVYSTYYLGNRSWQNGDTQIAVGDDVIIYGQLTNYNGTPETAAKKSCLYSLNGVTDGGTPGPGPGPDPGTGIKLEDFTNGDFEAWDSDSKPTGWSSVAGNATLQKSTDAHGGDFSVLVKGAAANKRMAYQEMSLEAGTYTLSCYAKAATTDAAVIRIGYAKLTNGVVADTQNDYIYNDMTTINNGDWQLVTYQFTLSAPTAVSLLVMNNKQGGKDVLIDDVTITKE